MKKKKLICLIILGLVGYFITVFCVYLLIKSIFTPMYNSSKVYDLLINQYETRDDAVYLDPLESIYYKNDKYCFKKKEIVYEYNDLKIKNEITKKIFYISDDCIIYRRSLYEKIYTPSGYKYTFSYHIINDNYSDKILNLPGNLFLSDIHYFNDSFIFRNIITNQSYLYNLILDEYSEISKDEYELMINCKYKILSSKSDEIEITNISTNISKKITILDLYSIDIVKKISDFYDNIYILNAFILNDDIYIFVNITNEYTLVVKFNYEKNEYCYFDWFYHKNSFDYINIALINKPNEDTVFTRYIKSYKNEQIA